MTLLYLCISVFSMLFAIGVAFRAEHQVREANRRTLEAQEELLDERDLSKRLTAEKYALRVQYGELEPQQQQEMDLFRSLRDAKTAQERQRQFYKMTGAMLGTTFYHLTKK